jgi:hypothetical protein
MAALRCSRLKALCSVSSHRFAGRRQSTEAPSSLDIRMLTAPAHAPTTITTRTQNHNRFEIGAAGLGACGGGGIGRDMSVSSVALSFLHAFPRPPPPPSADGGGSPIAPTGCPRLWVTGNQLAGELGSLLAYPEDAPARAPEGDGRSGARTRQAGPDTGFRASRPTPAIGASLPCAARRASGLDAG